MTRTPFSRMAGLYEEEAVCPFTTASASTIVEELKHARPDWRLTLEEGGEVDGDRD